MMGASLRISARSGDDSNVSLLSARANLDTFGIADLLLPTGV